MTQNTSCTLILAVLGVTIVAVILSLSFMLSPNCCGAPGVTETVASIYATNTAVQGWINETATARAWTLTPSPTPSGVPGVTETVASIYATNTAVQGWINETATAHAWTLTPSPTPH